MRLVLKKTSNTQFEIPGQNVHEDDKVFKQMQRLKTGNVFVVSISRPRILKHHRKLMAILAYVQEIHPNKFEDVEAVLEMVKISLGMFKRFRINGKDVYRTKSIAFDSMDQSSFEAFYHRGINALIKYHYLPESFDEAEFTRNIKDESEEIQVQKIKTA